MRISSKWHFHFSVFFESAKTQKPNLGVIILTKFSRLAALEDVIVMFLFLCMFCLCLGYIVLLFVQLQRDSWLLFSKNTPSYHFWDSQHKTEMAVRSSLVYNGNSYTCKTALFLVTRSPDAMMHLDDNRKMSCRTFSVSQVKVWFEFIFTYCISKIHIHFTRSRQTKTVMA